MGGTYTLLIELPRSARIAFGALGKRSLESGWYAYVGSAFGPGGFARIDRHRRVAEGANETRHWHIDYLLGHPASRLDRAIRSLGVDAECSISREIDGRSIGGVGATDCSCSTHLHHHTERNRLVDSIEAAHDAHS